MKATDLRKKSTEELGKDLIDLRKSQFSARMQVATQQTNKTDQLGKIQKDIWIKNLYDLEHLRDDGLSKTFFQAGL